MVSIRKKPLLKYRAREISITELQSRPCRIFIKTRRVGYSRAPVFLLNILLRESVSISGVENFDANCKKRDKKESRCESVEVFS